MSSALATVPEPPTVVIRRASGTITLRPAPRREPPFDDEIEQLAAVGPLDRPLPFDEWRPTRRPPVRRAVPARTSMPDPAAWGHRLMIGIVETSAGKRPLHQLSALLTRSVLNGLGAAFEQAARNGAPHWTHAAQVHSVHATQPADGIAELSATLRAGDRVRAVAMRLEVRHGRWRCTRLLLG